MMVTDASRRVQALLACLLLVAGAGCAGDGQRRKPAQTEQLEPVQIQLTIGLPFDSDGNGYPDTAHALAYLFPDSRHSDQPVRSSGTFFFEMRNPTDEVAAQWIFPPEIVAQAERKLPAGPAYSMYLRLAEGEDIMPPTAMDIRVQFDSTTGTRVRSTGRTSLRFGG